MTALTTLEDPYATTGMGADGKSYQVHLSQEVYAHDCAKLVRRLMSMGYVPDLIIPVARGGLVTYVNTDKAFRDTGLDIGYFPIWTRSYSSEAEGQRTKEVKTKFIPKAAEVIKGLEPSFEFEANPNGVVVAKRRKISERKNVLIVDDVDDQLNTAYVIEKELAKNGVDMKRVRRAVPYRKPYAADPDVIDHVTMATYAHDFHKREGQGCWIVFPSENEEKYPDLFKISEDIASKGTDVTLKDLNKAILSLRTML